MAVFEPGPHPGWGNKPFQLLFLGTWTLYKLENTPVQLSLFSNLDPAQVGRRTCSGIPVLEPPVQVGGRTF